MSEVISNNQALLDYVYERQKLKFGNTTKDELYRKLRCEIIEYQEATRRYWNTASADAAEDMMFEQADIIIMANRLYQEFQDEIAWALLSKYYNYETARYVKLKWEIVEHRPYYRDRNGNWQHKVGKNEKKKKL